MWKDYFYSLERKLDWEMVVESVALIEDGDAVLNATVYHLRMKRTWPAAQRYVRQLQHHFRTVFRGLKSNRTAPVVLARTAHG